MASPPPPSPGHPPTGPSHGPPPGAPQYAPPPGTPPPHAGPPQPPQGPGQPPYGPGPQQPYGQPPYGPPPQKQGMSTGAKIGIGVGSAVLVLALVIGAIIVLPIGDDEDAPTAPPDASETTAPEEGSMEDSEAEEAEDSLGDPAGDPEPQVYTGSGEEVVELDEPHDDTRIISIESDDYVHVNLQESNGDPNGLAAGIAGTVNRELYNYRDNQGTTAQLEVLSTADSWTITLEPLSTADSWPDPDEPLQGEGSEIFVLGWEPTDHELTMEHTGDSNFILWAFDHEAGGYENMANEVGDYESTVPLPSNTTIIQVSTAGEWTLTVS